jgi:hypothetical protein
MLRFLNFLGINENGIFNCGDDGFVGSWGFEVILGGF